MVPQFENYSFPLVMVTKSERRRGTDAWRDPRIFPLAML
jgi:hypothetical protein